MSGWNGLMSRAPTGASVRGSRRVFRRQWAAAPWLAVLATCLLAVACGGDDGSPSGGVDSAGGKDTRLVAAIGETMRSPDFVGLIDPAARMALAGNVNEALTALQYDGSGNLDWEPLLATSWERIGPLQWRFKLRDDVKFHDGQPMTATDVAFSINKDLAPDAESAGMANAANLKSAEVVDEHTVDVFTKDPDDYVFRNMYRFGVQPDGWGVENPDEAATTAMGTGPYRLVEFSTAGDRAKIEVWPDYWGGTEGLIDEVEVRVIPEAGARLAALKAGEVQLAIGLTSDLLREAPATVSAAGIEVDLFRLDTKAPPLDNVDVRRAMNMAIDRNVIIDGLYSGFAEPAKAQTIPPSAFGYDETLDDYAFDPAAAKQLIEKAGATGATLRMMCQTERDGAVVADICNTISQMLKDIGLNAEVDIVPFEDYLNNGIFAPKNGVTPPSMLWARASSDTLQARQTMQTWFSCSSPRTTFCDESIDKKISAASSAGDIDAQESAWKEVQGLLREQAPMVWLTVPRVSVATAEGVKGPVYPSLIDGDFFWRDWSVAAS